MKTEKAVPGFSSHALASTHNDDLEEANDDLKTVSSPVLVISMHHESLTQFQDL